MIMIWTVYGNGGREEFLEGWLKKEKEITEIKSPDELEPTHHRRPEGEERGDSRWDDPQAAAATRPAEMEAHPAEDGEGEKAGMGGGAVQNVLVPNDQLTVVETTRADHEEPFKNWASTHAWPIRPTVRIQGRLRSRYQKISSYSSSKILSLA